MNTKQTAPIIAAIAQTLTTVAPPVWIIGGIALFVWILSGNDKEKPENATLSPPPSPFPSNSGVNSIQNHCIPPISGEKLTVPPPLPSVPTNCIPIEPEVPPPLPSVVPALNSVPEFPLSKKRITQEHIAAIFNNGARKLDRKAAVAALKALGFGKSAAYQALAIDGRFAPWLQYAPDGIISWKS